MCFKWISDIVSENVNYEDGGAKGSIVGYDADFLLDYGWFLTIPGSVFRPRVFAAIAVSWLCCTAFAYLSCTLNSDWYFCIPLPDGDKGYGNLTLISLCSFLTIIFTSQLITRWWSTRMHLQSVMGKANNVIIMLGSILSITLLGRTEEEIEDARAAEEQIIRYLNLGHAILYKSCNKDKDFSDLITKKIATKQEVAHLMSFSNPGHNHIYSWITILVHRLTFAGLLGDMQGGNKIIKEYFIFKIIFIFKKYLCSNNI